MGEDRPRKEQHPLTTGQAGLTAGRTGYMTVDLEPGRYVWVSEGYGARGMVEEFTVR